MSTSPLPPPGELRPMRFTLTGQRRGWRLAVSAVCAMLHQLCEALVPILLGVLIDRALLPGDLGALLLWLGVLLATFIVLTLSYQRAMLVAVLSNGRAEAALRRRVLDRALHPRGTDQRTGTGEMLTITTSDSFRVAGITFTVVFQAATMSAVAVSAIALLLISVPLGLGVLIGAVVMLVGMHLLAAPIERRGLAEQASAGRASAVAADLVGGLRVLRGIRAENTAAERYHEASQGSRRGAVQASKSLLLFSNLSDVVSGVYLAALALAAGLMALSGTISLGELVTVVGLAQFLQLSLGQLGAFPSEWRHKRASASRIVDFLRQPWRVSDAAGTGDAPVPEAAALRWASAHTAEPVEAGPGELIGISAPPAAAKDIADRLAFRSEPEPGEITIAGTCARDLGPEAYREAVLAPPHEGTLFSGSMTANLLHDQLDAEIVSTVISRVALEDALRAGSPDDREVGEAGRLLSGGQRQRLLLGRAMAAASPVLVLHEPLTAVDSATESRIAGSLRDPGRATVLITASPVLLAACDRVHTTVGGSR